LSTVPTSWSVIDAVELGATLNGDAGTNTLAGTVGRDTLYGAGGDDVLTGGPGSDTFVYRGAGEAGDVITDFTKVHGDVLNLRALLQTFSGYDGANAFSGGYLDFAPAGADTLVRIDSDGGSNGFVTLATLTDVLLQQSDTANYLL
jgi:Ca2+-binding RTX toxin-like protein